MLLLSVVVGCVLDVIVCVHVVVVVVVAVVVERGVVLLGEPLYCFLLLI